jgi:hypothetical protein
LSPQSAERRRRVRSSQLMVDTVTQALGRLSLKQVTQHALVSKNTPSFPYLAAEALGHLRSQVVQQLVVQQVVQQLVQRYATAPAEPAKLQRCATLEWSPSRARARRTAWGREELERGGLAFEKAGGASFPPSFPRLPSLFLSHSLPLSLSFPPSFSLLPSLFLSHSLPLSLSPSLPLSPSFLPSFSLLPSLFLSLID